MQYHFLQDATSIIMETRCEVATVAVRRNKYGVGFGDQEGVGSIPCCVTTSGNLFTPMCLDADSFRCCMASLFSPVKQYPPTCLQCFDAIGWAVGRASGL